MFAGVSVVCFSEISDEKESDIQSSDSINTFFIINGFWFVRYWVLNFRITFARAVLHPLTVNKPWFAPCDAFDVQMPYR